MALNDCPLKGAAIRADRQPMRYLPSGLSGPTALLFVGVFSVGTVAAVVGFAEIALRNLIG